MNYLVSIAVLGLGEVGLNLAENLQRAGARVTGFDVQKPKHSPVPFADNLKSAVSGSDVVICLTGSSHSLKTARETRHLLAPGAVYADLNPCTPSLKSTIASELPAESFIDANWLGYATSTNRNLGFEISGPGAQRFEALMAPLGFEVEYISANPGDASIRRLIRDFYARGTAALVADVLWAAKSLGVETWALDDIARDFESKTADSLQNQLNETAKRAKVQSVEMTNLVETLADQGYESTMASGISLTLSHMMHGKKVPFARPQDA